MPNPSFEATRPLLAVSCSGVFIDCFPCSGLVVGAVASIQALGVIFPVILKPIVVIRRLTIRRNRLFGLKPDVEKL